MRTPLALLACASFLFSSAARAEESIDAQQENLPQELRLQEIYFVQEPLEAQWSISGDVQRGAGYARDEGGLRFELGLVDRLQVEAHVPVARQLQDRREGRGVGGIETGARVSLIRTQRFGLSTAAEVRTPSIAEDADEDAWRYQGDLVAVQALGPVFLNESFELEIGNPVGAEPAALYPHGAVALMVPVGHVVPTVEVGVGREEEGLALELAPGFSWHPSEHFELGGSLVGEVIGGDPRAGAFARVTFQHDVVSRGKAAEAR